MPIRYVQSFHWTVTISLMVLCILALGLKVFGSENSSPLRINGKQTSLAGTSYATTIETTASVGQILDGAVGISGESSDLVSGFELRLRPANETCYSPEGKTQPTGSLILTVASLEPKEDLHLCSNTVVNDGRPHKVIVELTDVEIRLVVDDEVVTNSTGGTYSIRPGPKGIRVGEGQWAQKFVGSISPPRVTFQYR